MRHGRFAQDALRRAAMLNVPLAPAAFTAYKDFLSDAKAFGFHLNFRRVLLDAGAAAALFIRIEERASNALLQADIVRAGIAKRLWARVAGVGARIEVEDAVCPEPGTLNSEP